MLLILLSIFILLLFSIITQISLKKFFISSQNEPKFVNISIVVAAKNESKNIESLIDQFKNLDYPLDLYEVIVVDDN